MKYHFSFKLFLTTAFDKDITKILGQRGAPMDLWTVEANIA